MMAKGTPQSNDKRIGARVRMRRLMLDMSLTKLADALQLTFQQVQEYERGMSRIGARTLEQIAEILQVPVEFFFEGLPVSRGRPLAKGEMPTPDDVTDFFESADGLALNKAFVRIKQPALRRIILQLVQQIARIDA
jgi:transcriptional regulator with XRE-family HTH domain